MLNNIFVFFSQVQALSLPILVMIFISKCITGDHLDLPSHECKGRHQSKKSFLERRTGTVVAPKLFPGKGSFKSNLCGRRSPDGGGCPRNVLTLCDAVWLHVWSCYSSPNHLADGLVGSLSMCFIVELTN